MALSSETTQSRDLTELRNHLKWLDEERRKTARRLADLEQRLAQQGRDLTDRETRIQELEWQLAHMSERVDKIPDTEASNSSQEQRMQDLEWHLSNINAQLVRLPKLDDELAQFRLDMVQSSADLETRLIVAQEESTDHVAQDLSGRIESEMAVLQEQIPSTETYEQQLSPIIITHEELLKTVGQLDRRDKASRERLEQLESWQEQSGQTVQARIDEVAATLEFRDQSAQERLVLLEGKLSEFDDSPDAMPVLMRLEQEMELRQAEEVRLANLIDVQNGKLEPVNQELVALRETIAANEALFVDSQESLGRLEDSLQDLDENWKPAMMEATRQLEPLSERAATLNSAIAKVEANLQALAEDQSQMRDNQVAMGDVQREQQQEVQYQLEGWQTTIDEQKDTMDRFTQQWLALSNQYKEARMAVQNFAHWQKQLEQQKREASEMLRIESNRMQSRWEGFLLEVEEQLKNFDLDLAQKWQVFEMDNDQRWTAVRRSEQQWREELSSVDDLIVKLQQDNRNLIWRVQAAQADAIKKWPRLLLEEVEKAVELNPNRRLQPAPGSQPSAEVSIEEAIEQGLIKVDYEDETTGKVE